MRWSRHFFIGDGYWKPSVISSWYVAFKVCIISTASLADRREMVEPLPRLLTANSKMPNFTCEFGEQTIE